MRLMPGHNANKVQQENFTYINTGQIHHQNNIMFTNNILRDKLIKTNQFCEKNER